VLGHPLIALTWSSIFYVYSRWG